MFEYIPVDIEGWIFPFLSFGVLIFLVVVMIYFKFKYEVILIELLIWGFTIIIGIQSISDYVIPYSPYLQILIILINSFILISSGSKARKR